MDGACARALNLIALLIRLLNTCVSAARSP
jgi:hypothetical protein